MGSRTCRCCGAVSSNRRVIYCLKCDGVAWRPSTTAEVFRHSCRLCEGADYSWGSSPDFDGFAFVGVVGAWDSLDDFTAVDAAGDCDAPPHRCSFNTSHPCAFAEGSAAAGMVITWT